MRTGKGFTREGFTGPHDHEAARRGIEWMREHHRRQGQGAFAIGAAGRHSLRRLFVQGRADRELLA